MREDEAEGILKERVKAGFTLQVVAQADLMAIKQLRQQCLDASIPAVLGSCAPGG
jgi:hypothetical protein